MSNDYLIRKYKKNSHVTMLILQSWHLDFKDSDVYQVGTVIRLRHTNDIYIIRTHTFQHLGKGFLNYLVEKEGIAGLYCAFHDDIDLEHFPP